MRVSCWFNCSLYRATPCSNSLIRSASASVIASQTSASTRLQSFASSGGAPLPGETDNSWPFSTTADIRFSLPSSETAVGSCPFSTGAALRFSFSASASAAGSCSFPTETTLRSSFTESETNKSSRWTADGTAPPLAFVASSRAILSFTWPFPALPSTSSGVLPPRPRSRGAREADGEAGSEEAHLPAGAAPADARCAGGRGGGAGGGDGGRRGGEEEDEDEDELGEAGARAARLPPPVSAPSRPLLPQLPPAFAEALAVALTRLA
mmetsp:Transcript_11492/g.30861  ORF Transcript_11492/g.30861 Transcript_11492/m.30861 type:complete len:266 (+) Transcript_11492:1139-1936(+)